MPPPLRPFDLESGVRVTYDVGYLCANFSLPLVIKVNVTGAGAYCGGLPRSLFITTLRAQKVLFNT